MKILAFDFSSPERSVAVLEAAEVSRTTGSGPAVCILSEIQETGERTTRALGMIEEALRLARVEREEVECLAVGLGPGSYTGIRAGIAVAQGWELARRGAELKIAGLSSAGALAEQLAVEGLAGRAAVAIDAQRGELYWAEYELGDGAWKDDVALKLVSLAEAQEREKRVALVAGPEVTRWFPQGRLLLPRAASLGRLAVLRGQFFPAEKLEPIYLRETAFVKAPPVRRAGG